MTADFAIRVLMGRGVGGSTIHNTNLCKRTPPEILDLWARKYGVVDCSLSDLRPIFEEMERDLSVTEIAEPLRNGNNQVLARGMKALGFHGGPLKHNRVGCRESGFCELGCAYDAKRRIRCRRRNDRCLEGSCGCHSDRPRDSSILTDWVVRLLADRA
jgi:choline dehydrogenase-like flavoprotein